MLWCSHAVVPVDCGHTPCGGDGQNPAWRSVAMQGSPQCELCRGHLSPGAAELGAGLLFTPGCQEREPCLEPRVCDQAGPGWDAGGSASAWRDSSTASADAATAPAASSLAPQPSQGRIWEGAQVKWHPGTLLGQSCPCPTLPWLWERCSVSSQQCCGAQAWPHCLCYHAIFEFSFFFFLCSFLSFFLSFVVLFLFPFVFLFCSVSSCLVPRSQR